MSQAQTKMRPTRRKDDYPRKVAPGVIQRGPSSFRWEVYGGGRRVSGTQSTLAEASLAYEQAKAALKAGRTVSKSGGKVTGPHAPWTLKRVLENCISSPEGWLGSKAAGTAGKNALFSLKYFGPNTLARDIEYSDLAAYAAWLEDPNGPVKNGPATVNRKLSAIRTAMSLAMELGELDKLPRFPKQRREPLGRTSEFTVEQEEQICGWLRRIGYPQYADFMIILADLGVRVTEGLWIRAQDIEWGLGKHGVVHIMGRDGNGTKNGRTRHLPLTKRVAGILRGMAPGVDGRLFDFEYPELYAQWGRVRDLMGKQEDPEWVMHTWRHTFACRKARGGRVDLLKLRDLLGHSTLQMVMRYARLMPSDLHDTVD